MKDKSDVHRFNVNGESPMTIAFLEAKIKQLEADKLKLAKLLKRQGVRLRAAQALDLDTNATRH